MCDGWNTVCMCHFHLVCVCGCVRVVVAWWVKVKHSKPLSTLWSVVASRWILCWYYTYIHTQYSYMYETNIALALPMTKIREDVMSGGIGNGRENEHGEGAGVVASICRMYTGVLFVFVRTKFPAFSRVRIERLRKDKGVRVRTLLRSLAKIKKCVSHQLVKSTQRVHSTIALVHRMLWRNWQSTLKNIQFLLATTEKDSTFTRWHRINLGRFGMCVILMFDAYTVTSR